MKNQIYPCLWFGTRAIEAAEFYCSIFKNSKIIEQNPMVVKWDLNGQQFMGLNSGFQYKFSPANSYVIECETQEEIDHYWERLGKNGTYNQCGWLDDQFGISWQVVPSILEKLISQPEKRKKVIEAFMQMKKFDIEKLLNA